MTSVDTIGQIRRAHIVEGRSIREISRELKVSRQTIRKALRGSETAFRYERRSQPRPRLERFVERLDALLAENANRPARERLTSRRLFELLRDEGYEGAYDSVQRHVRAWRARQGQGGGAVFIPLWFAPGEAYQFDWSHEVVVLGGATTAVKVAHIRLCHSRMFLVQAYPRESQEMVFDAHDRGFRFFGGACRRGIYDNMKTAVESVFMGKERRFNRRFAQMCSHYLVEPVACTPASGWEKGQVENQVGTVRERFFTPRLRFASYEELNHWLADRCLRYGQETRHPEDPTRTVWEVFEAERASLISHPGPFDGFHEVQTTASKSSLVRFDHNRYSVAVRAAHRAVQVRAYADRVVIWCDGAVVGEHVRRFGRGLTAYDPWHYVPALERKPGALRNGQPFRDWALPPAMAQIGRALAAHADGDRQFVDILMAATEAGLDAVEAACREAIDAGLRSRDAVLNLLGRRRQPVPAETVAPPPALTLSLPPVADCGRYDALRSTGEAA
jgi:transposase